MKIIYLISFLTTLSSIQTCSSQPKTKAVIKRVEKVKITYELDDQDLEVRVFRKDQHWQSRMKYSPPNKRNCINVRPGLNQFTYGTNKYFFNQDENDMQTPNAAGVLHHDLTKTAKRKLQGPLREVAKLELLSEKAAVYVRKRYGDEKTDKAALKLGKLTEVSNTKAVRKAKQEAAECKDLDSKDLVKDLILRKKEMDNYPHLQGAVNGYVQTISLYPFVVSLYTHSQLELLRRLLKFNPNACLHLDSTGSIQSPLPELFSGKVLFYYAIVVTLPNHGAPVTPLLEFLGNAHSSVEIGHCLNGFFRAYQEYTKTTLPNLGIRRVETDCSLALISAMMMSLKVGPTFHYLRTAWQALVNRTQIDYCHHICKTHAAKFIMKNILERYTGKHETVQLLNSWMHGFLNGQDLHSFCRRVKDAVLICGQKRLTPNLETVIASINQPTVRRDIPPWHIIKIQELPLQPPFYRQSPFGMFAIKICQRKGIPLPNSMRRFEIPDNEQPLEDDDENDSFPLNPHCNVAFLEYLLIKLFPLGAMLDHSLLILNEATIYPDTNAASESWNSYLKIQELKRGYPIKIGRFIVFEEEIIKGRLIMFETQLELLERTKKALKSKSKFVIQTEDVEEIPKPTLANPALKNPVAKKSTSGVSKSTKLINRFPNPLYTGPNQKPTKTAPAISLSVPEECEETWKQSKEQVPFNLRNTTNIIHTIYRIPYGGVVKYMGRSIPIYNTCNVDNCLQILYTLQSIDFASKQYIEALRSAGDANISSLCRAFRQLDAGNYNTAKEIVYFEMINLAPILIETGNFYGSEQRFLDTINNLVVLSRHHECTNPNCLIPSTNDVHPMTVFDASSVMAMTFKYNLKIQSKHCEGCSAAKPTVWHEWSYGGGPPFVIFCLGQGSTEADLQPRVNLLGIGYNLFAYTLSRTDHFTTVFVLNKQRYQYDGLSIETLSVHQPLKQDHYISTVWFKRS